LGGTKIKNLNLKNSQPPPTEIFLLCTQPSLSTGGRPSFSPPSASTLVPVFPSQPLICLGQNQEAAAPFFTEKNCSHLPPFGLGKARENQDSPSQLLSRPLPHKPTTAGYKTALPSPVGLSIFLAEERTNQSRPPQNRTIPPLSFPAPPDRDRPPLLSSLDRTQRQPPLFFSCPPFGQTSSVSAAAPSEDPADPAHRSQDSPSSSSSSATDHKQRHKRLRLGWPPEASSTAIPPWSCRHLRRMRRRSSPNHQIHHRQKENKQRREKELEPDR